MGRTIEIPRQHWVVYFDSLSKRAVGRPIRIEVENRDLGDQELTRSLPLVGIDLEVKGSEAGDLEVTVGETGRELMHHIDGPRRVYLKVEDSGNIDCLAIQDAENGMTLLFFEGGGVPAEFEQGSLGFEQPAPGP
jgi:hypothetical protein